MRRHSSLRKFLRRVLGSPPKTRPFTGKFRVHTGKSVVVVSSTSTAPCILPDLPPEIWKVIIEYAADVLPDSTLVSFLHTPSRHSCRNDLRTRLALTTVSRSFNAFAQSLLFSTVTICALDKAYMLLSAAATHGTSIRHLDIQTPLPPHLEEALIRAAPRLHSLSSINPPSIPLQALSAHLRAITHLALTFSSGASPCTSYQQQQQDRCRPPVTLPFLTSLKLTLTSMTNNAPFTTLASWSLPSLTHLSVLSSDCYYSMPGFEHFFDVHGSQLVQLELGQPDAYDDDNILGGGGVGGNGAYGGGGNGSLVGGSHGGGGNRIPLGRWCPNLREFICSSDAEWNWEQPDWIAPHVLLPTHATLEMIGIKSIHNRITTSLSHHHESPLSITPFFPLITQFASLLNPDAFPRLRYIRDLSEISAEMRMGTTKSRHPSTSSSAASRSSAEGEREEEDEEDGYRYEDDGEDEEEAHHSPTTTTTYAFDPSPTPPASSSRPSPYAFPKTSPSAVYASSVASAATSSTTVDSHHSHSAQVHWRQPRSRTRSRSTSLRERSSSSSLHAPSSSPSLHQRERERERESLKPLMSPEDHKRVLRFWASVIKACQSREVWFEDWEGVNVTIGSLRRVAGASARG